MRRNWKAIRLLPYHRLRVSEGHEPLWLIERSAVSNWQVHTNERPSMIGMVLTAPIHLFPDRNREGQTSSGLFLHHRRFHDHRRRPD